MKKKLDNPRHDIATQVTLKTDSGIRTRVDIVTKDKSGQITCYECKGSQTAPLTNNQKLAFSEIETSGGVVVGKGKPIIPGGTRIPPTTVKILRKGDYVD